LEQHQRSETVELSQDTAEAELFRTES